MQHQHHVLCFLWTRFKIAADLGAGASLHEKVARYTASVRCEEPCRVVRIPREVIDELIHREPRLGYLLLRRVAAALADRLEQTRGLLMRTPNVSRTPGP